MWCMLQRNAVAVFAALLLAGCASPQLDEAPKDNASQELITLFESLDAAQKAERDLLAPEAFLDATQTYAKAKSAKGGEQFVLAQKGLTDFSRFAGLADQNTNKLAAVLSSRSKAKAVKAEQVHPGEFADLDNQLKRLAKTLEQNPQATENRWIVDLSADYQKLELNALKYDIVEDVRKAIDEARRNKVGNYAPKTLMLAEEEMLLALSVLDQDRSRQAEARQHAANAFAQVVHAGELKDKAMFFDETDASFEDVLIWHENFVATAFSALLPQKIVRLPDAEKLQATLENLVSRAEQGEAESARLTAELVAAEQRENALKMQSAATLESVRIEMEQQILAAQLAADAERRRFQSQAESLAKVSEMFAPTEADVYNKGDTIVIRAHGLEFRTGASEVDVANLPLIAKVISAIELFPGSHILVAGHTDNQGDDAINQTLSEERAGNLARMLTNIGLISPDLIKTAGFGESQPAASNETRAGRSANRRVEIHIIREAGR